MRRGSDEGRKRRAEASPEPLVAALWAPALHLQALLRAQPELTSESLAVVSGATEATGIVLAASSRALAAGVRRGMRASQAAAVCPELVVRRRDPALELSATEALRDVAFAFSPRVEVDLERPGWCYLDASGLEALVGPAEAVARGLARAGDELGLALRVGVARTKTLARLAARAGEGCQVIPRVVESERSFLAALPLAVLEPDAETAAALARFGLRTVADLWQMPRERLAARLGPQASVLYRRALGEEEGGGLAPMARPAELTERILLDWSIAELEPLAFVLRGLVDRLVGRLGLHGQAAGDLRLSFGYESHGGCERLVRVASPTRDVRALVELCRVHLAEHPPDAAVQSVAVSAAPESIRPRQLSFFAPAGPAPEKLAVTLARLRALCGSDRVGSPRPLDTWAEDRFVMTPFDAAGTAAAANEEPAPPPPLTLRRFRPPRELEVVCEGERPVRLTGPGLGGRVVQCAGPFRRARPWWDEAPGESTAGGAAAEPVERAAASRGGEDDRYDLTLADGTTYRVAFERARERWVAEGWYD